ncbi:MAG: hypothetical protein A4E42_00876 [Methanoregulaceae archaeon PtaU1.Bin222]|nr:MAG: hypothetical protein A4E42_00876 [Methanoregulaceae archaeon PtaU1.Bin222]
MASRGMNVPETKMSGRRTRLSIDMISPGLSVGYAAKRVPIVENTIAVRSIPTIRASGETMVVLNATIPTMSGTSAIPIL